jgi:hypothetical protein
MISTTLQKAVMPHTIGSEDCCVQSRRIHVEEKLVERIFLRPSLAKPWKTCDWAEKSGCAVDLLSIVSRARAPSSGGGAGVAAILEARTKEERVEKTWPLWCGFLDGGCKDPATPLRFYWLQVTRVARIGRGDVDAWFLRPEEMGISSQQV